jgi:hypothetical protein
VLFRSRCRRKTYSGLDEYDIDCNEPFAKDGVMSFNIQCEECDYEFKFKVKIEILGSKYEK